MIRGASEDDYDMSLRHSSRFAGCMMEGEYSNRVREINAETSSVSILTI